MTNAEFSTGFDVLVNSYRRFKDFDDRELLDSIEFDEHEKSLFLTKAQEELVLSLYNGRNSFLQGFEETEELRRYLSKLICEADLKPITTTSGMPLGVDSNSKFFSLPDGSVEGKPAVWFITFESVIISNGKCENTTSMEVVPVRQDEYHRIKKNPFRGANDRRSLRLDLGDNNVEIVSKYTVTDYYIRYLRKPQPIVLEGMPNGLTIESVGTATECELSDSLHQRILELAVEMAMRSKTGSMNTAPQNTENKES